VASTLDNGMAHVSSPYPVPEAVRRVEALIVARGLSVLTRVDHSGDAAKVGLTMRPTELLIFGNPQAGTPLMVASPTLAIDLPLKVLVWEDGGGKVWISYNTPEYLRERHNIPEALLPNISGVRSIVEEAVRISR
jgi:uncharacterized protein (DUF302 family)